jgi:hypothetical protein
VPVGKSQNNQRANAATAALKVKADSIMIAKLKSEFMAVPLAPRCMERLSADKGLTAC